MKFWYLFISSVLLLSGCGGSSSSSSSIQLALKEHTKFIEGSAEEQQAITNDKKWQNVDYAEQIKEERKAAGEEVLVSKVHPFEQMNLHKARSFYNGVDRLTGKGELIHIVDTNCDDSHAIYRWKTIYNLDDGDEGEGMFDPADSKGFHCQFVASMAAGNSNYLVGVAPDADLVLSNRKKHGSHWSVDMAEDLNKAKEYGAIASNNSWGRVRRSKDGTLVDGSINLTESRQTLFDRGWTNDKWVASLLEGSVSPEALAASQEYITALDNFQKTGVIVFSAGNYQDESDVGVMAGLPEFYPQLKEAWLAVGYIDFLGDSIENAKESEFVQHSNKCGSAQEYCVVADGRHLKGATYNDGNNWYSGGRSGSSYSAPMVSGGIALLAQAFPNHTPEQLTDRLLASANNHWFTPEGYTEFDTHGGDDLTHGYHQVWGHGLPDFYAALRPITTSNSGMALYTGDSMSNDGKVLFNSSFIVPSTSFGDALSRGLSGETGYVYDALGGGFQYDMGSQVDISKAQKPGVDLQSELYSLDWPNISKWSQPSGQILSDLYQNDRFYSNVALDSGSLPLQSFFNSREYLLNDDLPYLEMGQKGVNLNGSYQAQNVKWLLGASLPIQSESYNHSSKEKNTVIASLEYGNPADVSTTLMVGSTQDKGSLLGLVGEGAYSLSDAGIDTEFAAVKSQVELDNSLLLTGVMTLANTHMDISKHGFINSADNVKSSSFGLSLNKRDILGDDSLSLIVSQPNRVTNGSMSIKVQHLADTNGHISHDNKNISLEPSARQLDYGISYRKQLDKDTGISLKHIISDNPGHMHTNTINSSFVGVKHKHLKAGLLVDSKNNKNAQVSYNYHF